MISALDHYLDRYAFKEQQLKQYDLLNTELIVVIPCYNEPNLIDSLKAIADCEMPCITQVIVIINASENEDENIKEHNLTTYQNAVNWAKDYRSGELDFHFILVNALPGKHAGVGLARKIGMDEAVRIFKSINQPEGVILCFDADCSCEQNLLKQVHAYFKNNPKSPGCSIHYEHPLRDNNSKEINQAIVDYELHLRFYINALKYAGFPYAHQTIGSSMAVRASAYCKQGGMNRRKAGEDFYFLNKIIPLGQFGDLNSTCVFPSSRISDRVPFGTGRAVGEWNEGRLERRTTYNPRTFIELKALLAKTDNFFSKTTDGIGSEKEQLSEANKAFLRHTSFDEKLTEIKKHSTNIISFRKRFYAWFDGFMAMKYTHFMKDNFYENIPIIDAANWLLETLDVKCSKDSVDQLIKLRSFDKFGVGH